MKSPSLRFRDLSPAQQVLVRLCQAINYGEIADLRIRNGEPTYDPPPTVLQDIKLHDPPPERPEAAHPDFELMDQFRQLLDRMEQLGDGFVHRIEVRAGIPHRLVVPLTPAAR